MNAVQRLWSWHTPRMGYRSGAEDGSLVIDSVVAGRPDFVALLCPTVKARAGGEPRVASDPRQAFTSCAQTGGLLVVQYAGPEWLPVVRDLRSLCGDGIWLVVAVAPDRLAEVSSLQHAGADEVVPWEGKPDAIAWAIERALSRRGTGEFGSTPTPPVLTFLAPASSPPPVLQRAPAAGSAAAPAAGAAAGPGVPAWPAPVPGAAPRAPEPGASPPAGSPAWPANLAGAEEAERLLAGAVAGAAPGAGPLAEAAVHAARKLSRPEREALEGGTLPVDAAVVRRAAVLRFRVALALQAVPQAGELADADAVQALLAEIDGVLAELKALEEGAPPAAQPGLDAIRSGLVSEAIDLTEAVQRLGPALAAPPPEVVAPSAARLPSRVISNVAGDLGAPAPLLGRGWLALLLLSAAVAGGYQVYLLVTRQAAVPQPTVSAGAHQLSGAREKGVAVVVPGKPLDASQLEALRVLEESRGNTVKEAVPGVYISAPPVPQGERQP